MSSIKNFVMMSVLVLTAFITGSSRELRKTADQAELAPSLTHPGDGGEGSGATCT